MCSFDTEKTLIYLLGLALRAFCFLLNAFRRSKNIAKKAISRREAIPAIKPAYCDAERFPLFEAKDVFKLETSTSVLPVSEIKTQRSSLRHR